MKTSMKNLITLTHRLTVCLGTLLVDILEETNGYIINV